MVYSIYKMRTLQITRGYSVFLDDDDFERFGKYRWYASICGKRVYASREVSKTHSYLHREIMKAPKGLFVDHKNHNTLDNRKENLRLCTQVENNRNRAGAQSRSKSGIRGVWWVESRKKWATSIAVNKRTIPLGRFVKLEDAIKARKDAQDKYYGEFAGGEPLAIS